MFESLHFIIRCLRYRFRTERLQIRTLQMLNLRGRTALDIGANRGIYCFWLLRSVGAAGRVIAFEAQPEMSEHIHRQKRRFGWRNLDIVNIALSDHKGQAGLSRRVVGDGAASIEEDRKSAELISVDVAPLDSLALDLSKLGFIKCDIEGHEYHAFLGAEQAIRQHRPVIQFESTAEDDKTEAIFDLLLGIGYSGVMFLGDHYLPHTNPDRIRHYKFGYGGHRDFLFFPPEAIGTIIPAELAAQFPVQTDAFDASGHGAGSGPAQVRSVY